MAEDLRIQEVGKKLAFIGSIKDEILEYHELAAELIVPFQRVLRIR